MNENQFKCSLCGNIYEKGWSDEESLAEMNEIWGEIIEEERAVICDDCFNKKSPDEVRQMVNEYKNEARL